MNADDSQKLESFWRLLKHADRKVLFFDYDGTLAPFNENPKEAAPYPGVRKLLNSINSSDKTRLIIVSGRGIEDVHALLSLDKAPEIWGSHGFERKLPGGAVETFSMDPGELKGLDEALNVILAADTQGRHETKPGCLAIHWRGLDNGGVCDIKKKIIPAWRDISQSSGLEMKSFDGGLELRSTSCNKGNVVKTVLDESGDFTGAAYLGDDLTDEDGFSAIAGQGLKASISILVRPEWRPTNADIWLRPPEELLIFLNKWISNPNYS